MGGSHGIATDADGEADVHPDQGERTRVQEGGPVSVIPGEVGLRDRAETVPGRVLEGREASLPLK